MTWQGIRLVQITQHCIGRTLMAKAERNQNTNSNTNTSLEVRIQIQTKVWKYEIQIQTQVWSKYLEHGECLHLLQCIAMPVGKIHTKTYNALDFAIRSSEKRQTKKPDKETARLNLHFQVYDPRIRPAGQNSTGNIFFGQI